MNTALMLALFLLLLALTAFFNLTEMALVAARASALHVAENGEAAGKVLDLKKRPGLFLAAIRAGDLVTDLRGRLAAGLKRIMVQAEIIAVAIVPSHRIYEPTIVAIPRRRPADKGPGTKRPYCSATMLAKRSRYSS